MSRYDDEPDESWDGWNKTPTASQIGYIETLCDELGFDYKTMLPESFDEASEMIDELKDELGWE